MEQQQQKKGIWTTQLQVSYLIINNFYNIKII